MADSIKARTGAGPDLCGVASAFRRVIADGLMCAVTLPAAGCDAHIAKPISPARVLDAISRQLAARAA